MDWDLLILPVKKAVVSTPRLVVFLIYHAFLLNARQKRETHWHNPSSKIRRVAIFVAPMRILEDILELHCDASGRRNKNARKGEEELKTDHHLDDDSNCNRGTKCRRNFS